MAQTGTDKLHLEHKLWSSEIKFWINEINFLKKILNGALEKDLATEEKEKITKYLNHLEHNVRFLKELSETIETHELFIREMIQFVVDTDDIQISLEDNEVNDDVVIDDNNLTDHDKTGKHIKKFRKRYIKLKSKVFKIINVVG